MVASLGVATLGDWWLTDTVRMEFFHLVSKFSRRDLRVADDFFERRCLLESDVPSQDHVNFWESGLCM